jgi:hypothetical protein
MSMSGYRSHAFREFDAMKSSSSKEFPDTFHRHILRVDQISVDDNVVGVMDVHSDAGMLYPVEMLLPFGVATFVTTAPAVLDAVDVRVETLGDPFSQCLPD